MVSDVTSKIKYIGVDDLDIDLFESQYVVPNGMSYNSYVILDEKIAIMDFQDFCLKVGYRLREKAFCQYTAIPENQPSGTNQLLAVIDPFVHIQAPVPGVKAKREVVIPTVCQSIACAAGKVVNDDPLIDHPKA